MRPVAKLMLVLALLLHGSSRAQDAAPSEYQVKAAFIFNFAKFIEWPPEAFTNSSAPIVIGIFGENPFGNVLEQMLLNKKINEHPLQLKAFDQVAQATNCHILFISASEKKRHAEIMTALGRFSVLTVSEAEGFTEAGGMFNFVKEANKIRFQINEAAAKKVKLKVSSKLLILAVPPAR